MSEVRRKGREGKTQERTNNETGGLDVGRKEETGEKTEHNSQFIKRLEEVS